MGRLVWLVRFLWGLVIAGLLFVPDLFRPRFMVGKFEKHLVKGAVLDLGCGPGHVAVRMRRALKRYVVMVDVRPRLTQIGHWIGSIPCATFLALRHRIPYVLYDGKRLPFGRRRFENIILGFVLSHTQDWKQVLDESVRCLAEGGRLIVLEDTERSFLDRLINVDAGGAGGVVVSPREWERRFDVAGLRVVHSETWTKRHLGIPFHNILFVLERTS